MRLTLETPPTGPVLVVEGDVDHDNVGQLIDGMRAIVCLRSPRILVDLTRVAYIDSAGIRAIYAMTELVNGGFRLDFAGASANLRRIFQVAGLTAPKGVRILPEGDGQSSESTPTQLASRPRGRVVNRTRSFPGALDELARIREFVGAIAGDVCLDEKRTFDLQVAVSEASANAIEHGLPSGGIEVFALGDKERLTITVSHPGRFLARPGDDPSRGNRGMGFPLMLALTDEVTVCQHPREGTKVSLSLFLE
jgi:anti-anti-sigma factor